MPDYKHLIVRDDVHEMVVRKHGEFLAKGINKPMIDLTSEAIRIGIKQILIEDTSDTPNTSNLNNINKNITNSTKK